jgi:hypothetical protein
LLLFLSAGLILRRSDSRTSLFPRGEDCNEFSGIAERSICSGSECSGAQRSGTSQSAAKRNEFLNFSI